MATTATRCLVPGLLVLSCAVLWYRSSAGSWLLPLYWTPPLLRDLLWWCGGFLAVASVLQLLRPAQARGWLPAAVLVYLIHGSGWPPGLGTALFLLSCWCLGRGLFLLVFPAGKTSGFTLALVPGLALQLALFGALLHLSVNHQALYLVLLMLPLLLLGRRSLRQELLQPLAGCFDGSGNRLNRIPWIPCVLLLLVPATVARYALFPSISGDDNTLHLRMWTELVWLHEYSFDVRAQIWSVAPFALDLLHAIVSLASGTDARSALNLGMYALLLRQLWCIAGHWHLQPTCRLLLLALFASTPLMANLLITLQTELFMALLASAGLRLLLTATGSWYGERSLALAALAALCCAAKLPGIVLGLVLLLPALWQLWPLRRADWSLHSAHSRWGFAGFLLACAWVALHSYVVAWLVTGNPLFPLYNGIFQSPWNDPVNFSDGRWMHGFSLASYWNAFFLTSQHYESRDFVAGFQYLFLLPLGFWLLLRRHSWRDAWALGLPLFGFGLVMFSATQYWRYLFPVMPLAVLAMVPLLPEGAQQRWQRRIAASAMLCCMALNLWFLPGISYLMAVPPGSVYTQAGRTAATLAYLPEKALSEYVSHSAPGSTVLYQPERPFGAMLHGDPWYAAWYAPLRRDRAARVNSHETLEAALREQGISHVVWNLERASPAAGSNDLLREYLSQRSLPLLESAGVVLSRLQAEEPDYRTLWQGNSTPGPEPQSLFQADTAAATALRVSGRFSCGSAQGTIVLDFAWSHGTHTRRYLDCAPAPFDFREALAVPAAAGAVTFTIFTQGSGVADAANLLLELH